MKKILYILFCLSLLHGCAGTPQGQPDPVSDPVSPTDIGSIAGGIQ